MPVPEEKRQRIERLIHIAAQASAASFIMSALSISIAWFFRPLVMLAISGMILPLIGFILGVVPLVGALKAQRRDIAAGLAGTALNALLFAYMFVTPFHCHHCHPRSACIANLKQLDGAKATWAVEFHKTTNHIPADSDLFGSTAYIRVKPTCPEGGTYSIRTVEEKPLCSIPGHTL